MTDEKLGRLPKRLERQQREREQMRSAIANYTGPITKCPPGRSTNVLPRRRGQQKKTPELFGENSPVAHQLSCHAQGGHPFFS